MWRKIASPLSFVLKKKSRKLLKELVVQLSNFHDNRHRNRYGMWTIDMCYCADKNWPFARLLDLKTIKFAESRNLTPEGVLYSREAAIKPLASDLGVTFPFGYQHCVTCMA